MSVDRGEESHRMYGARGGRAGRGWRGGEAEAKEVRVCQG